MSREHVSTVITPDEYKVHYARSILRPWPRALAYVLSFVLFLGLWWWGTRDSAELGLAAKLAFVPLVVMLPITTRWQRAEERRAKAARATFAHGA